ncbi:hypothetical protein GU243_12160 [Pseudarthrobacter psychrotolerans]|uniref:Lipoprotein n=1 Tax=Pseudarthrobacter psychrotolerans TaxID=2697569 RepID=A0A6P1NM40_9MICC|nr:hypothetical protein [Pseudarthrobacter psychrotolerans]QHK20368.1 hypothetical protein GU243_12160 [Pseudarthrobacter psychrotolerans]
MVLFPSSIRRALSAFAAAAVLLGVSGCAQQLSVENSDVPAWKATAMPSASGIVTEDAGKILNAQPIDHTENVPAGTYTLTLVCDGGGKAFLAVRSGGKELADLGAACYGTRESVKITLPETGPLELSVSSVDAPLIYAYQLVTAG